MRELKIMNWLQKIKKIRIASSQYPVMKKHKVKKVSERLNENLK